MTIGHHRLIRIGNLQHINTGRLLKRRSPINIGHRLHINIGRRLLRRIRLHINIGHR